MTDSSSLAPSRISKRIAQQKPKPRQYSLLDRLIEQLDSAAHTLTQNTPAATRRSPAHTQPNEALTPEQARHSLGLMRVNHTGEVCAQALYQGQALTAKLPKVRAEMEQAAAEEVDHLAWCEQRVKELGGRTSVFNPLWYGLSFGIGATAGAISDKISLGFVAATEDQVCQHLEDHQKSLPKTDKKSQAVVAQMLEDEYKHGQAALDAGGYKFPALVKRAMRFSSKAMTTLSYRV